MTNRPLYSLCVYAHLVDLVVICDRTDVTRTAGRAARDMTHRSHRTGLPGRGRDAMNMTCGFVYRFSILQILQSKFQWNE